MYVHSFMKLNFGGGEARKESGYGKLYMIQIISNTLKYVENKVPDSKNPMLAIFLWSI